MENIQILPTNSTHVTAINDRFIQDPQINKHTLNLLESFFNKNKEENDEDISLLAQKVLVNNGLLGKVTPETIASLKSVKQYNLSNVMPTENSGQNKDKPKNTLEKQHKFKK